MVFLARIPPGPSQTETPPGNIQIITNFGTQTTPPPLLHKRAGRGVLEGGRKRVWTQQPFE